MPARAAIQYSQDAFDTRVGAMMGRRMASETFLKAWIDHADADPLTAWVHSRADARAFEAQVREIGMTGPLAVAGAENFKPLVDAGALWLADPAIERHAWERRWFAQDAWSIVGITHTISSHNALDFITAMLVGPVQPWDALICTSQAVKNVVQTLLAEQAEYLADRLGATRCTGPELPVIPLAVHCDDLTPRPGAREKWRAELGIAEEDVAVLQFGRLSLHLKAHPQPLYLALEQAAARGGPRLHLILAGQPTNDQQGETFRRLAAAFADSVTTHFVDGKRADAGDVRAAADIFTLLSDNIQESFGLAPVEAMAAGLPVVGSDWDGLRDTIEHGVTGFLIDTSLPAPGSGELLARRHALGQDDHHHYIGSVAQITAVDVGQAADAFATLAADPDLRRRMGKAGQARARSLYDWRVVIGAYRTLLDQLADIRLHAQERAPRREGKAARPARMDPTALFAAHASSRLTGATMLTLGGEAHTIAALKGSAKTGMLVEATLPPAATLDRMLARLADSPATLLDLIAPFPDQDRRTLVSGVAWLLKMGLARRV